MFQYRNYSSCVANQSLPFCSSQVVRVCWLEEKSKNTRSLLTFRRKKARFFYFGLKGDIFDKFDVDGLKLLASDTARKIM